MSVADGDFFALLGPNGAGKSTTIGVISTLVNKTQGKIKVFGHDLDDDPSSLKKCIGIVPQEVNFNQFEKVFDILVTQGGYYGIPAKVAKVRAEKYLNQLGLWEKRNVPSRFLSGGMKRRLMIARALIHQPRLLILDEPTAGVDIELRRSMWEFLVNLNKTGTTIILTTHYLEEAEHLCRNVAIINNGSIVEDTTMQKLLNKVSFKTFLLDVENPIHYPIEILGYPSKLLDSRTIEVRVNSNQGITSLFKELSKKSIKVKDFRNKNNRLEELFISLVSKNHHRSKE